MELIKTRGIILKVRDYKEKDRLVYLFSGDLGKVTLLARGSRSAKGRFQGAVQPLTLCDFVLFPGRSIHILNEASPVYAFPGVKADYDRITYGSYFLELCDIAMADGEPNPGYFLDLVKALYLLDQAEMDPEQLARAFEMKTLVRSGNLPDPSLAQGMTESARHLVRTMLNRTLEEAVAVTASREDLLAVQRLSGIILAECFQRRPRSLDLLNADY